MNEILRDKIKIIAIPFAGGNKYSFKNISEFMSKDFEWITVELPGRGARFKERLLDEISVMVQDIFEQIYRHIKNEPYLIYGHSMGTLLGYELTKLLIQKNMRLPICLFFTGRGAPGAVSKKEISSLPEDLFWKEINEMGGLPKEILQHQDLLSLYYPILKSDFKAIENYTYYKIKKPLPVPLFVCMGKDEIGQREDKVSLDKIKKWNEETELPQIIQFLEGDHFFIFKDPRAIAYKISNACGSILNQKMIIVQ
ncbi:thioesterase II family protein [Aquimarina sp. Aq78]|uniref:thioesterase II family protein n=1 Tax=Aquimarina sp. Aq78 TaxID=1191889 RepID=UPI000D0F1DAA|nr:thioesterase domain-containing protein [Aquimarina sp. Aq78]